LITLELVLPGRIPLVSHDPKYPAVVGWDLDTAWIQSALRFLAWHIQWQLQLFLLETTIKSRNYRPARPANSIRSC